MADINWGKWKKVDLTTYPFFMSSANEELASVPEEWLQDPRMKKENQILMDIFSAELGGQDLEYFDSETDSSPPIPDELKIYCSTEEQGRVWWPQEIGNTKEHPYDWDRWFFLNHNSFYHTIVSGHRNRKLGEGWYLIVFEGLSPILIRPAGSK